MQGTYLTSTTTTTAAQIQPQKFRGHTLDILGVLSDFGGLTTAEIANKTCLSTKIVYEYCRRGYQRGIIEKKERWGWQITSLGLLVLSISTTTTTTTNHTNTTQTPHQHHTSTTPKSRQLNISTFTGREDLEESDRVVVVELVDHYERTGEKYRIFRDEYHLADEMDIAVSEVRDTLSHLKEEGCIYVYKIDLGWKIGLKKAFVERLQYV